MSKKDKVKVGEFANLTRDIVKRTKDKAAIQSLESQGPEGSPTSKIFDVLTFIEASWGLQMKLYPVQRFIVKLYYHIPLDNTKKTIVITDRLRTKEIGTFTEVEYLAYLYDNGRCNIREQDHVRRQLILSCGRRAGKCVVGDTLVPTSRGLLRIKYLGEAPEGGVSPLQVSVAQESGRRAQSAYFYNGGVKPTLKVTSKCGYSIEGTSNHRIKVLGVNGVVSWKSLSEITSQDYVCINRSSNLWFTEGPRVPALESEALKVGMFLRVRSPDPTFQDHPLSKGVPSYILKSTQSVISAFLSGLFGADLHPNPQLTLTSYSSRLVEDLQLLILNLGFPTRVTSKWGKVEKKDRFTLEVLEARLFSMKLRGEGCVSRSGLIPYQAEHLEALNSRTKSLLSGSCVGYLNKGGYLTYSTLGNVVKVLQKEGSQKEALQHFEKLQEMNYFYDRVVSVEKGENQVYDLNVPDGESFVANGMTNHNTTLSAIFAAYELYRLISLQNPQKYYGLPPGNIIQILSVATGKEQAGVLFTDVSAHLSKCEYFKPYISSNTQSSVRLRTPHDIEKYGHSSSHSENGKFKSLNGKTSLRVSFKAAAAKGLRGSGNIVIVMDEFAHFNDKGPSSAESVYKAIVPSAAAFSPKDPNNSADPIGDVESRVICISSPLNKAGKFFELFDFAMSNSPGSDEILAIQAPSWEMNPTIEPSFLSSEYYKDPASFMTEYGAEFSNRVRGWIERDSDLIQCIDPVRRPKNFGPPRYPHQLGLDIGLTNDSTAVAVTHPEGQKIVLDYHEVWTAKTSWKTANPHLEAPLTDYAKGLETVERLDFEEISKWIIALSKRFYLTDGVFDQHMGLPLEQLFAKAGLNQLKCMTFTRDVSSRMYQATKLLMFDSKVVLYNYPIPEGATKKHSPLIEELLSLQAEQVSRNQIIVQAPQIVGCHDDVSDAVIRAIWLSYERLRGQKVVMGAYSSGASGSSGASVTSTQHYQLARARNHGFISERSKPRSPMSGSRLGGASPFGRGRR